MNDRQREDLEYGVKFADVITSYNEARNKAGGILLTMEEILKTPVTELLDTMARNGIRFVFNRGELPYTDEE